MRYLSFAFIILVLFVTTACGGGSPELTDCEQAFADAAAVSDFQDTVEDLDPAVRSCESLEEWVAASEAYPAALDGVDPETFLRNRCQFGNFQQGSLCGKLN